MKARSNKLINIYLPRAAKVDPILFHYSLEEILHRQLIIYLKNRLLQHFLRSRKLSRVGRKAPKGDVGRMLCRPGLNAHKPKRNKTWNTVTASWSVVNRAGPPTRPIRRPPRARPSGGSRTRFFLVSMCSYIGLQHYCLYRHKALSYSFHKKCYYNFWSKFYCDV